MSEVIRKDKRMGVFERNDRRRIIRRTVLCDRNANVYDIDLDECMAHKEKLNNLKNWIDQ
ncbi:hypothetical protein [Bacillus sp. Marseille-Q3570]|uniref:hypothetical protein n=1 Tax=Bacillus sp. Marseille-Q3570 TaxID=2963522 RepID=UPI0021B819D7|nr:hypothetical protein [Bacillus sp. Marseille-Q3570]